MSASSEQVQAAIDNVIDAVLGASALIFDQNAVTCHQRHTVNGLRSVQSDSASGGSTNRSLDVRAAGRSVHISLGRCVLWIHGVADVGQQLVIDVNVQDRSSQAVEGVGLNACVEVIDLCMGNVDQHWQQQSDGLAGQR